ncbi:hypothetical protein [Streptomyces sp. SID5785]|uniref:hypothetical protein n=1 Tax=Streptomyces sp. SID5785 TaxID=2690309 RepID=UPI0019290E2A
MPPPGPADPVRALAAALLNLCGLGLGYALLRRWLPALGCVAATVALLLVALPADPDGVPAWALAGYGVLLLLAALDGARRGLRAGPAALPLRPVLAAALGLALLVVPAGGAYAYDGLRDDAVEDMLLDRLAAADALVERAAREDFGRAEPTYRSALARYRALTEDHPGSRAAHRVHDSLGAYYRAVAAPYRGKDRCAAVAPLEHLRTVPDTIDRSVLGALAAWPDTRLATALLDCGTGKLGTAESDGKGGELGELLRTFPQSAQADRVEPALRAAVTRRTDGLDSGAPCTVTGELRRIGDTAKALPDPVPGRLRAPVAAAVRDGTYACGMDEFGDGKFGAARRTLAGFATAYRDDARRDRARQVATAAEIAEVRPAAGDRLPRAHAPGGARMELVVSNDGPDPVEILYTGPVTGRLTVGGCGSCSTYPSEAAGRSKACKASGRTYPKRTLRLPAGTYHFLHRPGGSGPAARSRAAGGSIQPGYTYTQCSYVVRAPGLGADL